MGGAASRKPQTQFLCYKTLKKCLKNIPEETTTAVVPGEDASERSEGTARGTTTSCDRAVTGNGTKTRDDSASLRSVTAERRNFVKTLNDEMKKFNAFFMNAEEDLVMRERALGEQFHALVDKETGAVKKDTYTSEAHKKTSKAFADFHGELVLLEHWTSLNYTALVKILKKHDKRSSLRLRSPFLVSALRQPFYSTEVLTELIQKTEGRFRKLHELVPDGAGGGERGGEPEAGEAAGGGDAGGDARRGAASKPNSNVACKTAPALARMKAAIVCWTEMKDEDSVKRPFGDSPRFLEKSPGAKKAKRSTQARA
jgi:hypothetical protein